jgi:osmoprotectant transport system ATP-binding protein
VNRSGRAGAIEFRDVHLSRGAQQVLRGFSLGIASGETLALVGRSGAGKSTILKLINRLLVPDSGDVLVQSRQTTDWDPFELRRQAGYVMQEVGLFPHLTVGQNIGTVPRLLGWDDSRVNRRIAELLELVGLEANDYAERRPDQLSGGQRQRVGVARALAADPPILLMDEPFGALDPVTRSEIHREFRRIQEHVRKTVVLVTHDMAEAFALATHVGVLSDGVLAVVGEPAVVARSTDARVRPLLEPLIEATAVLDHGITRTNTDHGITRTNTDPERLPANERASERVGESEGRSPSE